MMPLPDLPSDRDWVSPPTATCRSSRTDQHPVRRLAMTLSMSMATVWKMTGEQEPSCSSQAWPPALQHPCLHWLNLSCADRPCACHVCSWVDLLQSSSRYSSFEVCVWTPADSMRRISSNWLRTERALKSRFLSPVQHGLCHFSASPMSCLCLALVWCMHAGCVDPLCTLTCALHVCSWSEELKRGCGWTTHMGGPSCGRPTVVQFIERAQWANIATQLASMLNNGSNQCPEQVACAHQAIQATWQLCLAALWPRKLGFV